MNLMPFYQIFDLPMRYSVGNAKLLYLVGTCHHAAIIVRKYNNRLVAQFWAENALAGGVKIIAVG